MHAAAPRFLLLLALLSMVTFVAAGCGGSDDSAKDDDAKVATSEGETEGAQDSDSESAVEAGIEYEDSILPIVGQLKPLLQRYDTTTDKLVAGTIDTTRAVQAFGTQADAAFALAQRVRDIDVDDEHLSDANEQLAVAFDRYAAAMNVMTNFNDGMSDAQIEQTMARATAELDEMFAALDTWSTALVEDPEGRAFTRTATAFTEISEFVDSL